MNAPRLNQVYSALTTRRRYEVWFLKMALADGSGAWWFRYLLTKSGETWRGWMRRPRNGSGRDLGNLVSERWSGRELYRRVPDRGVGTQSA